jgi:plastocyanin
MRLAGLTAGSPAALAAVALAIAGCGSSSGTQPGTTGARAGLSATATTTVPGKGSRAPRGPEVITTPKYASPSHSARVHSGVVQIAYRNITIKPDTLRVKVGSTVRWTNFDHDVHNVTSRHGPQRLSSGDLRKGAAFSVRLTKPGIIRYECTHHPVTMNGTIEVVS